MYKKAASKVLTPDAVCSFHLLYKSADVLYYAMLHKIDVLDYFLIAAERYSISPNDAEGVRIRRCVRESGNVRRQRREAPPVRFLVCKPECPNVVECASPEREDQKEDEEEEEDVKPLDYNLLFEACKGRTLRAHKPNGKLMRLREAEGAQVRGVEEAIHAKGSATSWPKDLQESGNVTQTDGVDSGNNGERDDTDAGMKRKHHENDGELEERESGEEKEGKKKEKKRAKKRKKVSQTRYT